MTPSDPNSDLRRSWIACAVLLLASMCGLVQANERSALTLDVREADGSRPRALLLAGTWPDTCTPRFLRTSRDGPDITLQLQASTLDCVARLTPFQVSIETRSAFGAVTERQIYRTRITVSRGNDAAELIGFRLLDLGATPVQPESGFWWSKSGVGETGSLAGGGMGLEVQGRQLAVSLMAFAADGTPTWYFGSADLHERTAQVPLIRLLNGGGTASDNGRGASVEAGPLLALEFIGPTQARAWLLGPVSAEADAPLALRHLVLSRAIFDDGATGSSWLGGWVLVTGKESRVVELVNLASDDGESFRLSATGASSIGLDCRYRGKGSGAEVDSCRLVEAGKVLATMNQVGLDRISGSSPDGSVVQLLRVIR